MGFPGGSDGKESTCDVETWVQSPGWEEPLVEGMATRSSILAWRISRTEKPGGLQSMGSQRVSMTERLSLHSPLSRSSLLALAPGTAVLPMLSLQAPGFLSKHEVVIAEGGKKTN